MNKIVIRTAAAALSIMLMGSCNIYKKYDTPDQTPITKAYKEAREMPVDSAAFGNLRWEQVFTDPMLADLINKALENNNSLTNARLNVEIAQAQLKGARLAYLPSLAIAPNGAGASYAGSSLSWSYQIPAQVSWEIDIFGKLLNNKRSAQAQLLQSEDYAQAVRSQIISAVANTYYAAAAIKAQLELSKETAQIWNQNVQAMKDFKIAGRVTEAAVVQSSANYYSIIASIADLEVQLDKLNNTMSLLLNELPHDWSIPASALQRFTAPDIVRAGVPMAELAARPDVAAAEQSLAVAYYATNSARAAFYPTLNITANGGFTNLLGSMIKNPGDWFVQLAGSLAAPIFSRGQNIARLQAAKAQQQQAMNNFEYTIMSAAAEVSDALTLYNRSTEKAVYLVDQVDNLQQSVSITNDLLRYYNGTYLEVLTAQQSLLSAQIGQISCDLNRTQAVISLYQALGGGR